MNKEQEDQELSPEELAIFDFADKLKQAAEEYGWAGAVTVIDRLLAEALEDGR